MTEWLVEVVKIDKIQPHTNADKLEIVTVHDDYPCVVAKGQFKQGDLAVYVPVDSIVSTSQPEFSFLGKGPTERIKAKRLRGTFSMGLLVPARPDMRVGDIVADQLGVIKYEPQARDAKGRPTGSSGYSSGENAPDVSWMPLYTSINGLRRYKQVLTEGEPVIITEKIHGQNARFIWHRGNLWVGSHTKVKREPKEITWWDKVKYWTAKLALRNPDPPRRVLMTNWWYVAKKYNLANALQLFPDVVFYGEVYGSCQDLHYDSPGDLKLVLFDALENQRYVSYDRLKAMCKAMELPIVPELYRGPWHVTLTTLAEGQSTLAPHVREGFIVRPEEERSQDRVGRVIFKQIGEGYLLR